MREVIYISIFSIILSLFVSVWNLFLHWLSIFTAPAKQPEMFWIIIPIWINWFFTEFFQEKYGTNFGNAVSNGAVAILAPIDWTRYMVSLLENGRIQFTFGVFLKFFVTFIVFAYGIFVIIAGIKINKIVFYVGRIRWITYIMVMFTPIVYNVIKMDLYTLASVIVFFPLFYWVIEIFDRITPEPRLYREDA